MEETSEQVGNRLFISPSDVKRMAVWGGYSEKEVKEIMGVDEKPELLQEIVFNDRITDDKELEIAETLSIEGDSTDEEKSSKLYWEQSRRVRTYLIRKVVDLFYTEGEPNSLIELGSAGDISPALALPNTKVTSVDIDDNIFLNCPFNGLPENFLRKLGIEKELEGWSPKAFNGKTLRRKTEKLNLVRRSIPNWEPEVGDAERLVHEDNSFDMCLFQGTADMLDFIDEGARVVKPGGILVGIIHEFYPKGESQGSVYKTQQYNSWEESYRFVTDEKLEELGLERIGVPEDLRNYEELAECNYWAGPHTSGYVFEVFRKK